MRKKIEATYDCIPCAIGSLIKLYKQNLVPVDKQDSIMSALLKHLSEINLNLSPPIIGQQMHRLIRELLNNPDPYSELKHHFNKKMLDMYLNLKESITKAEDPFQQALRFAIAGNVIDFGPNTPFDINKTIERAISVKLGIDDSKKLRTSIRQSNLLLYLGDNAGEIVMDRLFLETIKHPNVYFAVRGNPIINDVTKEDAEIVGIDKIAKVISNGDDAPGTILENTSQEFQEIFDKADLIISKGQGNYESLCGSDKNIFFILMAKCKHVADTLGVKNGSFIVKKQF